MISMASGDVSAAENKSPRPLHTSRSFSRLESSLPPAPATSRTTVTLPWDSPTEFGPEDVESVTGRPNSFQDQEGPNKKVDEDENENNAKTHYTTGESAIDPNDLPIELLNLADSFTDSLSAKVHVSPPSAEKLSQLFQEFYILAASHINTHISALKSRHQRQRSPESSTSSRQSTSSRFRVKAASLGNNKDKLVNSSGRTESEQQMLTSEELAERKVARKVLEKKRTALEEAIERRVCDKVYDRIWRHRNTQDEAQDEKLRSKTAALAVVGIGLTDLGIDLGNDNLRATSVKEKEKEVREWLEDARVQLRLMNRERYPLGKLQHLKAAHKCIVDTLSHFHPSSSADEIMPMLIYTLITSPPEGINVISNLCFIQRFRSESKIDGEAAYCLTNLEAAITFLETVDLASLRADEVLSGPPKSSSQSSTPGSEHPKAGSSLDDVKYIPVLSAASVSPAVVSPVSAQLSGSLGQSTSSSASLRPTFQPQNRRLSDLFQPPAQVLGAASDAVFTTADQGFKTIGDSLGNSFNFLLGKLKETQEREGQANDIIVPKTLDEARKLVGTPPSIDNGSIKSTTSIKPNETSAKADDKVLNIIGGRKSPRERSVESIRSAGSGKRVAFAEESKERTSSPLHTASPAATNPALVESMRNLGNTLNPMSRISGMGMMRGFGRTTTTASASPSDANIPISTVADSAAAFPDLVPQSHAKEAITRVDPPIKRFMEVQNPGELRIKEVLELLRDYRRLAGALKDLGVV